jgi:hypothetical protein
VTACKLVSEILTTVLLNIQVFWDASLKVKALPTFKMPETTCPVGQHHIPEVLSQRRNHTNHTNHTNQAPLWDKGIKHLSLKYSKMKKWKEELMQTRWFKNEI